MLIRTPPRQNNSTRSCSKGSNEQQIVEQMIQNKSNAAGLMLREIPIFRNARPFHVTKGYIRKLPRNINFRKLLKYPEEEGPCLSKYSIGIIFFPDLEIRIAFFYYFFIFCFCFCMISFSWHYLFRFRKAW